MDETHFDAIVVGSGFGGSVMAYCLAEAGLRVCLVIAFGLFFLAIRGTAARAVSSLSLGSPGHRQGIP
jgi:glycine/D-amino acid oxidase-like deaminating enzyme